MNSLMGQQMAIIVLVWLGEHCSRMAERTKLRFNHSLMWQYILRTPIGEASINYIATSRRIVIEFSYYSTGNENERFNSLQIER